MDDPITTEWLKAAHADWRQDMARHNQDIALWGKWYASIDGPQRFRDWVDAERMRIDRERMGDTNTHP